MRFRITVSGITVLLATVSFASGLAAQGAPTYGALFAYDMEEGATGQFVAGYREHLEWHRAAGDTLGWYGWFVLTGEEAGVFVDGIFGVRLRALDERVDPPGDRADAARTTGPHARTRYRKLLRRVPQASSTSRLEERRPSRFLEAFTITATPAERQRLEALLRSRDLGPLALYAVINGSDLHEYLLLVPRDDWAAFEDDLLRDRLRGLGAAAEIRAAIWLYRPDLSLLSLAAPQGQ